MAASAANRIGDKPFLGKLHGSMSPLQNSQHPVPPDHVHTIQAILDGAPLIDVREQDEVELAAFPRARVSPLSLGRDQLIDVLRQYPEGGVIACAVGARSDIAIEWARAAGLTNWISLDGGVAAWQKAGQPIISPLSSEELERYGRQIRLPMVGANGQKRIARAQVLIVGAGGLGVPVGTQLAGAGVGTLGVVDGDVVSLSNLHRQLAYRTEDVGRPKAKLLAHQIGGLNPNVTVRIYDEHADSKLLDHLLRNDWDVVVDCTDNMAFKFELARSCILHGLPLVHGSVYRNEGRLLVVDPNGAPCWQCAFPDLPPADLIPTCADAGVLGPLPGVVGSLQAAEALRLILDPASVRYGSLLLYDLLAHSTYRMELRPRADCPVCSTSVRRSE